MYPSSNFGPNYELQLSFHDVKDIQHLYGDQYWMLKQLKLEEDFTGNISDLGFPSSIKSSGAALHFRNGRYTVFFTGHECWKYER
ncbi:putative collagenase 3-like [Scophthalmus maximus]|uniref:Putative collagenase 3-like n=1 Tax=Scophthalmus maximus TaxID=52904 RepID=A0A2U9B9H4_SCOMX|nr:putative collagenase 3-like [Scophthalmus maximus]